MGRAAFRMTCCSPGTLKPDYRLLGTYATPSVCQELELACEAAADRGFSFLPGYTLYSQTL